MTYVKDRQTGVSFDLPTGETCRDEAPLVLLGTRFLLRSLTGTTFQSEARPVTQNIGRTAKKTIGGKRKHVPHIQR